MTALLIENKKPGKYERGRWNMAREQLKNLTEPMYYILLSLSVPRHGYEIMQVIWEKTEGRVRVGAGTLYALLGRFEAEKLIERVASGDRKKTYRLTESGMGVLLMEYRRLKALVDDGYHFLENGSKRPEKE